MAKPKSPFQHEALRDTHWVGKGVASWWVVVAILIIATALAVFLN